MKVIKSDLPSELQSVEIHLFADEHPLNYRDCPESECEKYFKTEGGEKSNDTE